jgi:hypothetical protein
MPIEWPLRSQCGLNGMCSETNNRVQWRCLGPVIRLDINGGASLKAGRLMKNWRYIAMHTAAAAAFIFLLQRYGLNASLDSSLLWALTFGACAAGLAYMQSNR